MPLPLRQPGLIVGPSSGVLPSSPPPPGSIYYHGLIIQPDCAKCPLQLDIKVLPDGPIPAKLCFVGEGPGDAEIRQGKGFIGPSGKLLWALASRGGINRGQIWVTNGALCRKRKVQFRSGAELSEDQVQQMAIACCRRRLIGELLYVTQGSPSAVIVPLGNYSLSMLGPRPNMRIFAYRGSVMQIDLFKLWEEVNQA